MRQGDQQTSPKMVTFEQRPAGEGRSHRGVGGKRIRGWGWWWGGQGRGTEAEAARRRAAGGHQLREHRRGSHLAVFLCKLRVSTGVQGASCVRNNGCFFLARRTLKAACWQSTVGQSPLCERGFYSVSQVTLGGCSLRKEARKCHKKTELYSRV